MNRTSPTHTAYLIRMAFENSPPTERITTHFLLHAEKMRNYVYETAVLGLKGNLDDGNHDVITLGFIQ